MIVKIIGGIKMKKLITLSILTGLLLGLTGCENKEDKKEAERKAKRDSFIKPVDTSGANAPTKLPF